jgi:hypothetical protein
MTTVVPTHAGGGGGGYLNSNNSVERKVKYATPEMSQIVTEAHCKRFNDLLMRAIINKKTRKNQSYLDFITAKYPK